MITSRISKMLTILCLSSAIAAPAEGGTRVYGIDLDVREEALDNGLEILMLEDHSAPLVSFHTFYKVGSRNEEEGITGISHFIEQMMFNGTEKFGPGEIDRIIESGGGYSNASTSKDMTVYYEEIPSEMLETVFEIESDRMANLIFRAESMRSEMKVVLEERRSEIDNSLEGRIRESLFSLAFRRHSYGWPVLGREKDLLALKREDCIRYYNTHYKPGNAVLVIVGDFDSSAAVALAERYFGPLPAEAAAPDAAMEEPAQGAERRTVLKDDGPLDIVTVGYRGPKAGSMDTYVLDVLQKALDGGRMSILDRELVRGTEIAVSAGTYFPWRIDPALFVFTVRMKKGRPAEEGERELYRVLDSIAKRGLDQRDLDRAKKMIEADFVRRMETVSGRAMTLGRYEILLGDFAEASNVAEVYSKVSSEDIATAARKYFASSNRNVVTVTSSEGRED